MYPHQQFFSEDAISDEEIDALLNELPQIEPPDTLIDTILASVANLPVQKHYQSAIPSNQLVPLYVSIRQEQLS